MVESNCKCPFKTGYKNTRNVLSARGVCLRVRKIPFGALVWPEVWLYDFAFILLVLGGDRISSIHGHQNPGKRVHPHGTLNNRGPTCPATENNSSSAVQSRNFQFFQVRKHSKVEFSMTKNLEDQWMF